LKQIFSTMGHDSQKIEAWQQKNQAGLTAENMARPLGQFNI